MRSKKRILELEQEILTLKKSKDWYLAFFENVQDVFSRTDMSGNILEISPSIKYFSDFNREEIIGSSVYNLYLNSEDRSLLISKIMEKGELNDYEIKLKTKTSFKFASVNARLIYDGENKPHHIDGSIRDISERKKNEEELRQKNDELIKLNSEKDKFFSIIAHDLRSPFNSFLGFTELLADEPQISNGEIKKIALLLRKSAGNLYELLENLLEWARMQQGIIPCCPALIFVLKTAEKVVETLVGSKEIEVVYDIPATLKIVADIHMFQSIIQNLVSNAIKFTPKKGVIKISAISKDNFVEICVSDTGIGMNQSMVDDLFRLGTKTSRKGLGGEPGTGLGLILCQDFITQHSGKLWVKSEEGKGSEFHFTLPAL